MKLMSREVIFIAEVLAALQPLSDDPIFLAQVAAAVEARGAFVAAVSLDEPVVLVARVTGASLLDDFNVEVVEAREVYSHAHRVSRAEIAVAAKDFSSLKRGEETR